MGFSILAGLLMIALPTFAEEVIHWQTDHAKLNGPGCKKEIDAFVTTNGDDLSIVFTELGLDLASHKEKPNTGRTHCMIQIPAEISSGIFMAELIQQVTYGVTKTERSSGTLSTRSHFFGFPVSPYDVHVPYGTFINDPLLVSRRVDRFGPGSHWKKGWCKKNRERKGKYQAQMVVAGQKDGEAENLIMFVDGLDLRFELMASLAQCGGER